MAKYGFDDDELKKLFAEAGAAVKKVQATPRAEEAETVHEEPAREEPVREQPAAPLEKHDSMWGDDDFSQPVAPPQPKAPPVQQAAPVAHGRAIQVVGGSFDDTNLTALLGDQSNVVIPWKSIKFLALGRVEDGQVIAWLSGRAIYYINDKRIGYKGMIPQLAPSATQNWRNLINHFCQKTGLASDPGLVAFQTPGGLIPKYPALDLLFAQLK
jgi:hypothetical protein